MNKNVSTCARSKNHLSPHLQPLPLLPINAQMKKLSPRSWFDSCKKMKLFQKQNQLETYFAIVQPRHPHSAPHSFRCLVVGVLSPLRPAPHWLSTLCTKQLKLKPRAVMLSAWPDRTLHIQYYYYLWTPIVFQRRSVVCVCVDVRLTRSSVSVIL